MSSTYFLAHPEGCSLPSLGCPGGGGRSRARIPRRLLLCPVPVGRWVCHTPGSPRVHTTTGVRPLPTDPHTPGTSTHSIGGEFTPSKSSSIQAPSIVLSL